MPQFYLVLKCFENVENVGNYIVIIEEKVLEFWNNVSPICSPHEARLTENIVSPHLLGVEQVADDIKWFELILSEMFYLGQTRQT